jgi:hypothetical protein
VSETLPAENPEHPIDILISEENREKAQRGEKVLLGMYTCSRCQEPIEHWYLFDRWCRSTKHTSKCGFDDYKEHDRNSQGRDAGAEYALVQEYRRIYAESPAKKAEEAARTSKYLAEAKAHLDVHARCRSMAETIFALDHRVKPAEAMERARVFLDYYDAEERSLREAYEYAEAQKARTE